MTDKAHHRRPDLLHDRSVDSNNGRDSNHTVEL